MMPTVIALIALCIVCIMVLATWLDKLQRQVDRMCGIDR